MRGVSCIASLSGHIHIRDRVSGATAISRQHCALQAVAAAGGPRRSQSRGHARSEPAVGEGANRALEQCPPPRPHLVDGRREPVIEMAMVESFLAQ